MEIHPDAPENPLYEELTEMIDLQRLHPTDYTRGGKVRHMDIAEHNEEIVKQSLLDLQNKCLPTLNNLRNDRNVEQIQERVYHKLKSHIDKLNICILKSRTANQVDYCFNQYQSAYNGPFQASLKEILLDYWAD